METENAGFAGTATTTEAKGQVFDYAAECA